MRENVDHHDICNRATVFDINGNAYQLTIGGFSSPGAYIRSVESTIGKESYNVPYKSISYSELYNNYYKTMYK